MKNVRIVVFLTIFTVLMVACKPSDATQIGDFTWVDQNKNGIQDKGEGPLASVRVDIYEKDGDTPLQTTRRDKDGMYSFSSL